MKVTNKSILILLLALGFVFAFQLADRALAVGCATGSECPNSYYFGQQYCQGNSLYQDQVTYSCVNGTCVASRSPYLIQNCYSNQCLEGLWYIGCSKEPETTQYPQTSGPTAGQYCYSHSYQQCSTNSVYWFDSCGRQQELVQTCSANQICSSSACQNKSALPLYTGPYDTQALKGCFDNKVYWYDSLGIQKGLYENCNLTNSTCYDGRCLAIPKGTYQPQTVTPEAVPSKDKVAPLKEDKSIETAAVSESPFINFIKKWYLWFIIIVVLIILFVFIFRRVSSST